MKHILLTLFSTAICAITISCSTVEPGSEPDGQVFKIEFSTKGVELAPEALGPDDVVKEFRVLIFRTDENGNQDRIAYNKLFDLENSGNPVQIEMMTGLYDFVFIANEGSDPALSAKLNDIKGSITAGYIHPLYFESGAFSSEKNIPMVGVVRKVKIKGKDELEVNGNTITGTWNIKDYLKRLGVRVNLNLSTTSADVFNSFESLEISYVPKRIFLLENTFYGTPIYNISGLFGDTESPVRVITTFDNTGSEYNSATKTWTWISSRIILPSSVFSNPSMFIYATTFKVNFNNGAIPMAATIGYNEKGGDYTLPRNTYYDFNGVLSDDIQFTVGVGSWDAVEEVVLN